MSLGEDFSLHHLQATETLILFGVDVVLCKVGQALIRQLCLLVNVGAAVFNSETMAQETHHLMERENISEAANL